MPTHRSASPHHRRSLRSGRWLAIGAALAVSAGTVVSLAPGGAQTAVTVTALSVTPRSFTMAPGMQEQFSAVATLAGGGTQNVTANAKWSASSPLVALAAHGHYRVPSGAAAGATASVTASYGGHSAKAAVTVSPLTALHEQAPASLQHAQVSHPTATGTFKDGVSETVTGNVYWTDSLLSGDVAQAGTYAASAEELGLEGYVQLPSGGASEQPGKLPRGGGGLDAALPYQTPQVEARVIAADAQLLAGTSPAFITFAVGEPLTITYPQTSDSPTVTGSTAGTGSLFAYWWTGGAEISAVAEITVSG